MPNWFVLATTCLFAAALFSSAGTILLVGLHSDVVVSFSVPQSWLRFLFGFRFAIAALWTLS